MNALYLSGRCAADPTIPEGKKSLPLRMAVDRYDADKRENVAEFYTVWVHGKLASVVQEHVRKGDKLFVEGRIGQVQRENQKFPETILAANHVEFIIKSKPVAVPEEQDEKGFKF